MIFQAVGDKKKLVLLIKFVKYTCIKLLLLKICYIYLSIHAHMYLTQHKQQHFLDALAFCLNCHSSDLHSSFH